MTRIKSPARVHSGPELTRLSFNAIADGHTDDPMRHMMAAYFVNMSR